MKPHVTRGTKVKAATLQMFELVFGLEQREKLEAVPFFRSRRVSVSFNITF
jgi:hypothetical protein